MVRAGRNIGYPQGVIRDTQGVIFAIKTIRTTIKNSKTIKTLDASSKNHALAKSAESIPKNLSNAPQKSRQNGQDASGRGLKPLKTYFLHRLYQSFCSDKLKNPKI